MKTFESVDESLRSLPIKVCSARFEVPTAVKLKIQVFWDITPW
jgi:hypothetical protein